MTAILVLKPAKIYSGVADMLEKVLNFQLEFSCTIYAVLQALKYLLQGRLTKCPMTLSLGRTYV
jgi:hypothetical protein